MDMTGVVGQAGAFLNGPVGLALNALTTLFIGLLAWWLKGAVGSYQRSQERAAAHDRIILGTEERNGLVDIVSIHDDELDDAEDERDRLRQRVRVAEARIDQMAEEAGLRTEMSALTEELREEDDGDGDDEGDDPTLDFTRGGGEDSR